MGQLLEEGRNRSSGAEYIYTMASGAVRATGWQGMDFPGTMRGDMSGKSYDIPRSH